jgi:hypothetical protein
MQLETFVKVAEALQVSADYLLRPDVPEVKAIYQGEFAELLEDCSASEMETILKIVREVKASMHKKLWGDRIFEKCGIGRDERGDGGKTLEIRGKRRLPARDGGANYQQS